MEHSSNTMIRHRTAFFYAVAVAIVIGFYVLFNQSFQQLRVPPIKGGGIPIGELFLVLSVFFVNHKTTLRLLHETKIIYPLVLWGLYGMISALLNFGEHGFWALRDVNHVIEAGYLYVGFAIFYSFSIVYENRKALVSLSMIVLLFSALYMFRDYLEEFSPRLITAKGVDRPLLVSYSGTINILIWIAAVYIIYPSKRDWWKVLVASIFIFTAVSIFQSRVTFLSIAAIFLTLLVFSFRRGIYWAGAVAAAGIFIVVIGAADLPIEGRRGYVNLRMLGQMLGSTGESGSALRTTLLEKKGLGKVVEKKSPGKVVEKKSLGKVKAKVGLERSRSEMEASAEAKATGIRLAPGELNLQQSSEEFAHPGWRKVRSSVFSDVAKAPNGTKTADKLVERRDDGTHYVRDDYGSLGDGRIFTASYFVKAAERTWVYIVVRPKKGTDRRVYFDLSAGTKGAQDGFIESARIAKLADGWYRIAAAMNMGSGYQWPFFGIGIALADKTPVYTGDGAGGVLVWGAQVEAGELSPYQRTERFSFEEEQWIAASRGSKSRLLWWADIWRESLKDWRVVTFGIGPGPQLGTKIFIAGQGGARSPHNSIVSVYGRFGVVGLVLFMALQLVIFRNLVRGYYHAAAQRNSYGRFIILSVILFMAVIWSFAMVQDGFETPYTAIPYYFLMGLGLAVAAKKIEQRI